MATETGEGQTMTWAERRQRFEELYHEMKQRELTTAQMADAFGYEGPGSVKGMYFGKHAPPEWRLEKAQKSLETGRVTVTAEGLRRRVQKLIDNTVSSIGVDELEWFLKETNRLIAAGASEMAVAEASGYKSTTGLRGAMNLKYAPHRKHYTMLKESIENGRFATLLEDSPSSNGGGQVESESMITEDTRIVRHADADNDDITRRIESVRSKLVEAASDLEDLADDFPPFLRSPFNDHAEAIMDIAVEMEV